MAVFAFQSDKGLWSPSPLAAGPFAGLQGGAVAGLLTAEIEAAATEHGWGQAVTGAAWFLRPTPLAPLRTQITVVRAGGRVAVVDNTVWPEGEDEPSATVRVTLLRGRPVEAPGLSKPDSMPLDPSIFPLVERPAPHGGPWFMEAMEARSDGTASWFRLKTPVVDGAGPLACVLGPADWAHGISRPLSNVLADPNPNLTVQLVRAPIGDWIGVRPRTQWEPGAGLGMGHGVLLDVHGEIGAVSMAVALMPFPNPAPVRAEA